MAKLTFYGAIQQVTGSCYLITTESSSVLLECGMHQGSHEVEAQNAAPFPFAIDTLDAVVLSHAHLDHSGLLPKLVKEGYRGPIYMTPATHDLLEVMLNDAAHLEAKDIEWENRQRRRADRPLLEPLYTVEDVATTLAQRRSLDYDNRQAITADISLRFHNAGHILGAAIVELGINEKYNHKRLVFSGDLGNSDAALLSDPEILDGADVLLLESTYGNRLHRSMADTLDEFRQVLTDASDKGGNVLIPSFAVGRTQDVLFCLGKFYREGMIQQQQVFLDSPMAIAASRIYFQHLDLLSDEQARAFRSTVNTNWREWLPTLRFTESTEESMQINNIAGGAIIIAGSGMCTGGRIRHHLKNNLWRNNAHLLIVGFQAEGTLGRAIVDGAERINLFGKEVAVRAQVHTLGGFSAHADQRQLLSWAEHLQTPRPEMYLVHGELTPMLELQKQFYRRQHWYANIPRKGESIEI
jgi:metallo-beta-lactamase family protein